MNVSTFSLVLFSWCSLKSGCSRTGRQAAEMCTGAEVFLLFKGSVWGRFCTHIVLDPPLRSMGLILSLPLMPWP